MEIVVGEATDDHVVDEGLLAKMEDRFFKSSCYPSTLPPETGTNEKRCIFRLPRRLKNINGKWLEPQVVALGPYHHGKPQLQMMEELKWRCLAPFMESRKGKLAACLIQLRPLEKEVRECYSESESEAINLMSTDELLQMMVIDGFFILALFFRAKLNLTELDRDERSIYNNPLYRLDMVILPKIFGDLLLLENQIPSCVLNTLYTICFNISSRKSLFVIATNFLCSISIIPESRNMPATDRLHWLHLLDLVRYVVPGLRSIGIRRTASWM
ncbi:UPF0481 protein At3g47200-like isoform X2 [Corylus avellana]|uniref:UPF0481 protein At3g47200-like isoform X2 n=1 Tax=Corylus avellana TaxID=13451 RepID=UPI00286D1065|nr:UPF0481 protein At3g47200-like isoform X2 [Corylus avellana]